MKTNWSYVATILLVIFGLLMIVLVVGCPAPELFVTPSTGLDSQGPEGGPFAPDEQVYKLSRGGSGEVRWVASPGEGWVTVTPDAGTLVSDDAMPVTVSINESAALLKEGWYTAEVRFVNETLDGKETTRPVRLVVGEPPPDGWQIAIFFESEDLDNMTLDQRELCSGLAFREEFEAAGNVFHGAFDASTVSDTGADPDWEFLWDAVKTKPTPRLVAAPKGSGQVQDWPLPANAQALYSLLED